MLSIKEIIDKVMLIAISQIGITEEPAGSNRTIYGEDYGLNGQPWCCIFLWWVFAQAGYSPFFYDNGRVASCSVLYKWAKNKGLIVTEPAYGDIVIYSFNKDAKGNKLISHCGLYDCEAGDKYFYSIEGNTSTTSKGSQDNGGCVARRKRSRSSVYAFIRPYPNIDNTIKEYVIKEGDTLWSIARSTLGNGCYWRKIYDRNNMKNTLIRAGQKLIIP